MAEDSSDDVQIAVLATNIDHLKMTVNRIDSETQRISVDLQQNHIELNKAIGSLQTDVLERMADDQMTISGKLVEHANRFADTSRQNFLHLNGRIDRLLYFVIASMVGLVGVMAKGFHWF